EQRHDRGRVHREDYGVPRYRLLGEGWGAEVAAPTFGIDARVTRQAAQKRQTGGCVVRRVEPRAPECRAARELEEHRAVPRAELNESWRRSVGLQHTVDVLEISPSSVGGRRLLEAPLFPVEAAEAAP